MRSFLPILLLLSVAAKAQDKLMAVTENGKPFILKKVGQSETLFGIARYFGLTPKEIAAANKMDEKAGLKLGQQIKVPLGKSNLGTEYCTGCTRVYYKVPPKEGLFRIATNFNGMGVPALKKLNNLSSDNVSIGQDLVVGYINPGSTPVAIAEKKQPVKTENPPVKTEPAKPVVKEVAKTVNPPLKDSVKKVEEAAVFPVKETILDAGMADPNKRAPELQKSAFTSQFLGKGGSQQTGVSAIFKSTSGWNDNRYYVLMSNVAPGTIVKVQATLTNKVLYAKVLGELPNIKPNEGILIRISNAAASALGGGEDNMDVVVSY